MAKRAWQVGGGAKDEAEDLLKADTGRQLETRLEES